MEQEAGQAKLGQSVCRGGGRSGVLCLRLFAGSLRPVAGVDQQIDGDEPLWDDVGIVEYPCPVAFFAMVTDPGFQERAVNKDAGVETTWIMVTHLEPSPLPDGYAAPESPFPPTEEDPAFELIHVKDYHDIAQYEDHADEPERTGAEAWDLYSQGGSAAATEIGSLPTARFTVQGVLAGDDRIDRVRRRRPRFHPLERHHRDRQRAGIAVDDLDLQLGNGAAREREQRQDEGQVDQFLHDISHRCR